MSVFQSDPVRESRVGIVILHVLDNVGRHFSFCWERRGRGSLVERKDSQSLLEAALSMKVGREVS